MTAKETAERLGVSVRQLNRYQAAGLIVPVQNVPRGRRQFREEDVDRLQASLQDHSNGSPNSFRPDGDANLGF